MAAGLGFKDFVTGEVLTAADVDGYLMQGVWVFASAAARDAAVTSPQESNFAYLKDTNVTTYYTGSAWANLDTTGMTNPMTTTGDTIYSSSGSTPARLGIGSTGQVLTVAGGVPSWATPAGGGGMTSLASGSLPSSNELNLTSISGSYKNLQLVIRNMTISSTQPVRIRFNGEVGGYQNITTYNPGGAISTAVNTSFDPWYFDLKAGVGYGTLVVNVYDYADTSSYVVYDGQVSFYNTSNQDANCYAYGTMREVSAISSIKVYIPSGTFTAGTYTLYGVK